MQQYTVDYFIKKFEAIDEKRWIGFTLFSYGIDLNGTCAMGFCGGYTHESEESFVLSKLLRPLHSRPPQNNCAVIFLINDSKSLAFPQSTPKQRILAALYDIKRMIEAETEAKAILRTMQSTGETAER